MIKVILIICCITTVISGIFQGRYDKEIYHKTIDLPNATPPSWWPYNEWRMSLTACIANYLAFASLIAVIITYACDKGFKSILFVSISGIFTYLSFIFLTFIAATLIWCLAKIIAGTGVTHWLRKLASSHGVKITNQCF